MTGLAEPTIDGVYETVLYATDIARARDFYCTILGFHQVADFNPTAFALRIDPRSVLLIFDPDEASISGREVPSHGTSGEGHVAFRIPSGSLGAWREHLKAMEVAIEQEIVWPSGARSLYVRDPAQNSIELVEGEIWKA